MIVSKYFILFNDKVCLDWKNANKSILNKSHDDFIQV